jgi:predicted nucleic acid-binding protein
LNIVDSSAWIEFFVDGPNAACFETPIRDTETLLIPAISLLEVYRYVLRQRGREAALDVAAAMRQGRILEVDTSLAIEAAELGASLGLPLADSVIYASTLQHGALLWTQNADFAGLQSVEYRSRKPTSPD